MMLPPLQPLYGRGAAAAGAPLLQSPAAAHGRRTAATTRSYCSIPSLPAGAAAATSAGAPVIKLPTAIALASSELCGVASRARAGGSAASW